MLMNTTFLGDSFSIKWQSRVKCNFVKNRNISSVCQWLNLLKIDVFSHTSSVLYPDFATCSILTIEKNVENTAFGLYFFNFML